MQEVRPLAKTTKRLDADEDMLARDFAELNTALSPPYLRVKCVHSIVSKLPNSCYGVLEVRSSSSSECQNETSAMFEDVSAAITPTEGVSGVANNRKSLFAQSRVSRRDVGKRRRHGLCPILCTRGTIIPSTVLHLKISPAISGEEWALNE